MSVALRIYEQLTEAGEDKVRAKVIAEAFEHLEDRYPQLKDVATQRQVSETELRLQKEIKDVQLEIREVEAKLQTEIAKLELEIKDVGSRLSIDIERVRASVAESKSELIRWVVSMGVLQSALIIGVLLKVAHLI